MCASESESTRAVSPVVAVILMVAVTVILASVVGLFALQQGESLSESNTGSAGVSVTDSSNGVSVTYTTKTSGVDKLIVSNGTVNKTLSSIGESVTLNASDGERIIVYSVSEGDRTVLTTYEYGGGSTATGSTVTTLMADAFEDGDTSVDSTGWSGWYNKNNEGTFSAQSTTVLEGSYSAKHSLNTGTGNTIYANTSSPVQPENVSLLFQIQNGPDSGESTGPNIRNGTGGFSATIGFHANNSITPHNGEIIGTWKNNTAYRVTYIHNWSNQTVDVIVRNASSGSIVGQTKGIPFRDPVSGITRVRMGIDYDGGDKEVIIWDDVTVTDSN